MYKRVRYYCKGYLEEVTINKYVEITNILIDMY